MSLTKILHEVGAGREGCSYLRAYVALLPLSIVSNSYLYLACGTENKGRTSSLSSHGTGIAAESGQKAKQRFFFLGH